MGHWAQNSTKRNFSNSPDVGVLTYAKHPSGSLAVIGYKAPRPSVTASRNVADFFKLFALVLASPVISFNAQRSSF
jgi:hypothetical protein